MKNSEESLLALLEDDSPIEDETSKKAPTKASEELRQKRLEWLAKGRIKKGESPSPERKAAMLEAMQRAKAAKAKKPNEFELTVTPIFIKNKECGSQIVVNRGGSRSGKGQPLTEPVLTPDGWKNLGNLSIGDKIFSADGSITIVKEIINKGKRQVYKFIFDDGSFTYADGDHLWKIQTPKDKKRKISLGSRTNFKIIKREFWEKYKIFSTEEIINYRKKFPKYGQAINIPATAPIEFPHKDVPIDPYTLGFLLGDGHFGKMKRKNFTGEKGGNLYDYSVIFTTADEEILNYLSKGFYKVISHKYEYTYRGKEGINLKNKILALGLGGIKSQYKWIPEEYLYNDIETRLNILKGLMDSDGYIYNTQNSVMFTTTSQKLMEGIKFLVESFGGKVRISYRKAGYKKQGIYIECLPVWNMCIKIPINPFKLKRKADKFKISFFSNERILRDIIPIGEEDCGCIIVNHPSGLYLTRSCIVTHNSQALCQLMLERFFTYPKIQILILRKTLPALRDSTLKMMNSLVDDMNVRHLIREEKISLNWHNRYNGSLIHFGSLDIFSKIKSSEWSTIWMEEANEFLFDDFIILKTRLSAPIIADDAPRNQMFLSLNPDSEDCWIKTKVVDGMEDCTEIVSSYRDNPFLSEDYIQSLESLIMQDYNKYRIYCLGEWGKLEDLIYSNWDTIQRIPEDHEVEKVFYGLDFGYKVESGLVRIKSRKNDLYEEELLYKTELTNTDLGQAIKKILPDKHKRTCKIYADNAEPDRIEELRREGLNVVPARKGPHSVRDGIDFIQRKKVHILESSSNLIKEKRNYSWKKDKLTGKIIADEPVKFMDHLCLEGSTKVYTTKGPISIKDLVGQEGYTYCYDNFQHRISVKKFNTVRLTGKKEEVWKLILDNYTELMLTPNHLVMLRDESWKEAGYLQIGESLMPFYCRMHRSYGNYLNINLNNGEWLQAHRLVYNDCIGPIPIDMTKWNVHHIDNNSLNNNPDNLTLLDSQQHASLHRKGAKFSDESRERLKYALNDIEYTDEEKQKRLENMKRCSSFAKLWHSSPEGIEWHKQHGIYTMEKAKNGIKVNKICQVCESNYEVLPVNAKLNKYCSNNCKQKAGRIRNAEKRINKSIEKNNHKVLSIEFYGYEDVYNMEVERCHNFVANGIIVHNCDAERMAVWSELGSNNTPKIWVIT